MNYALILATTFSPLMQLLLALTLWFVYAHNRNQKFTFYLGNAMALNGSFILLYAFYLSANPIIFGFGVVALASMFIFYSLNLLWAVSSLSNVSVSGKLAYAWYALIGFLTAIIAAYQIKHQLDALQLIMTLYAIFIGIVATLWLWNKGVLARLVGPLFMIGPLMTYVLMSKGDLAQLLQLYLHIFTRTTLALVFVYIAFERVLKEQRQSENERKKLQEQLHHSQKMDAIGQLAGGVAHDFNNMLAGILGMTELLKNSDSEKEREEYLGMIETAARHAAELTSKLLSFARKGKIVSTTFDISSTIADAVSILDRTVNKNVTIRVENHIGHAGMTGDSSQILNVIINLGVNAWHAMPNGGQLTFAIDKTELDTNYCNASPFEILPGFYIEIAASDTGCGIPPDILPRIFEPFFTTKEQGKGTGLGLAAIYGAVQDHHGAITVYSEPGKGTIFHIYFPLAESDLFKSYELPSPVCRGSGTILLVDDEPIIRITAEKMLTSMGYSVLVAINGREAVDIYSSRKDNIDLVILDMVMPVMGGRETFERLMKINGNVKIIVSSGFSHEENFTDMTASGLKAVIRKPFRKADLSNIIASVIGK